MRFYTPGYQPTRQQNRFMMAPVRQINGLHCAINGSYLSSVLFWFFFSREQQVWYRKRKNERGFSETAFARAMNNVISNLDRQNTGIWRGKFAPVNVSYQGEWPCPQWVVRRQLDIPTDHKWMSLHSVWYLVLRTFWSDIWLSLIHIWRCRRS